MDKILWNNEIYHPEISVVKINSTEYKLKVSNKHHNIYQTIINDYYFTNDLFFLDCLEDILKAGLTNQIIDNVKYQTLIYEINEKININLLVSITSKLLKGKSSEFSFTLDKITLDDNIKHKFIVEDVIKEIHYPIIDFEPICLKIKFSNSRNNDSNIFINFDDYIYNHDFHDQSHPELKKYIDNWIDKKLTLHNSKANFHDYKKYGYLYILNLLNVVLKFIKKTKKYNFVSSPDITHIIFKKEIFSDIKKIRVISDLNIPYLKNKKYKILSFCKGYNLENVSDWFNNRTFFLIEII